MGRVFPCRDLDVSEGNGELEGGEIGDVGGFSGDAEQGVFEEVGEGVVVVGAGDGEDLEPC